MKIKIALLGLCFANSIIHPIYADQYEYQLEADEIDVAPIRHQNDSKAKKDKKDKVESKNLIKLGTTIAMSPAIVYQGDTFSPKNSIGANLTFKADVPKAWYNKAATVDINTSWDGEGFTFKKVTIGIGKMVTVGYTSSIFAYEKADPDLLISPGVTVLQIKNEYTFDWFRLGYALERPIALQVGLFDKNQPDEKSDKKEENKGPIQLDNLDNKDRPFKIKNSIPSVGLNLGFVMDQLNIGLSGLGRLTDYTHSTDPSAKNLPNKLEFTYGGDLGIQYQVIPKKITVTGQGAYVHGLGDYLSGLAPIQKDKTRQEMCAAYYTDKEKDSLSLINAWGAGGTLAYCAIPEWTFAIKGSYLATVEDPQKPAAAFRAQWNASLNAAYQFNKYLMFSGGYSIGEELKVDNQKNEGKKHTLAGGIKFSL